MKDAKNAKVLIIIGAISFCLGIFLYVNSGDSKLEEVRNNLLTKEEATSIISEKVNYLIKLYEDSSKIFDVEVVEENGKTLNKINNYSDVINTVFSEKGISQFENMSFGSDKFVTKNENEIYFLNSLPSDNSYLNSKIFLNKVNVKENELIGEITFSDSKLEDNDLTYYVIIKEIRLVKVNDLWLVDDFLYSNEY